MLLLPVSPTTLFNIALEEWSHGFANESMESFIGRAIRQVDETQLTVDGLVSLNDCTTLDTHKGCHPGG